MKNLLLLLAGFLFLGLAMSSCAKTWTCECSTATGSDSVSFQLENLRKNDAQTRCDEYSTVWGQCTIR